MTFLNTYLDFWSKALGVSVEEMNRPTSTTSSGGSYLERHKGRYVYLYRNLQSGKRIFTATKEYFKELETKQQSTEVLDIERILLEGEVAPAFCDIDYCLFDSNFNEQKLGMSIQPIADSHALGLQDFLNSTSDDERNILDLNFENEFVFGTYQGGSLQGVSRSVQVKNSQIADITVLVKDGARGKGYGKSLVSAVVKDILTRNLVPKYRVEESNYSSRRVAEQLGLVPRFSLKAWEVAASR